jgi:hypothetical protein
MEPDCVVPYQHVPVGPEEGFKTEIEVGFAEEGGRLYACLPVRSVGVIGGFPYPFLSNEVRRDTECGTPLLDQQRGVEAMATILSGLSRRTRLGQARILNMTRVSQDGPVFAMLQAATRRVGFPLVVHESYERGLLNRRSAGGYLALQDQKARKEMRRLRRRLSAQAGGEVRLVDHSSRPGAADRYLALEESGYKVNIDAAMTGRPGEAEWFRDLCRRFAAAGRLHMLGLLAGEDTVAAMVWLRAGNGLFGFKMSYDERYASCSPGLQLMVDAMEYFHVATDADWLDSCGAHGNEMLLRLHPDRRVVASLFIPLSKNPVDWAVARSLSTLRPAHRWAYDRLHPLKENRGRGRVLSGGRRDG